MKYRLDQEAIEDLYRIREFISQQSPQAAMDMTDRIFDVIEKLADHPHVGEGIGHIQANLRRFSVKPYVIYFRSQPEIIEIVRVLHRAQDANAQFE